MSKEDFPKFGI
jgi:hypothetical protein